MDRRQFLGGTATAAATLLSGSAGGSDWGSSASPSLAPATAIQPNEGEWRRLQRAMAGTLIRPPDPAYSQAHVIFNTRFDGIMPQAVARCVSAADIQAVLEFAKRHAIRPIPRSGGHSFAGYSTGTGIIVDVEPLNSIQVNGDGTATIGAGAKLADIYDQLTAQGVSIPSGSCLSLGIAGIAQGGGIGVVDRMYGLTCDALVSAQIVTADGRRRECSANEHPDLFWAVRGGGGGNFGVATSFTFQTHTTQDLTSFGALFQYTDLPSVFAAWQSWLPTLPDSIFAQLILSFLNPNSAPTVVVRGVSISDQAALQPYWDRFLASAQATPVVNEVLVQSYRNTIMAACTGLTVSQCHIAGQTVDGEIQRVPFASTSDFYGAPVPPEGIQALMEGIDAARTGGIFVQIFFDSMGGALGRVAPDATAFVHRKALFSAEYFMFVLNGQSPGWSNGMRARMQTWTTGGAYVNYTDPLITDWQTAYYGTNYKRLTRVKAKYDPNSLFRFPQGVVPARFRDDSESRETTGED
jgi:FAD/FMN-containing dehydrogenase